MIKAQRNGEVREFSKYAWARMGQNKYGWEEVKNAPKKPEPLKAEKSKKQTKKK